jgi:glycosyltransferase involved in cell wall biosynthesis
MVFFAHRQTADDQAKAGFGVSFEWDVDLLSGYQHQFLNNVSDKPGTGTFAGCDTPEIAEIIRTATTDGRRSFDVFIVSGWQVKCYRQAVTACRAAGIPVVVRGDSQLRSPRSWFKRLAMEFTHRWLLKKFDGFLAVGRRNREYLDHFGARSDQIILVPHFVDNQWFAMQAAVARPRRMEMRKNWGVGEDVFVALFVGKFQAKKRPLDLIHALRLLQAQHQTNCGPHIMAVFVGSGALENKLRAYADDLQLNVHFAGFKNQSALPSYYTAADALVLPSDGGETWGLVVNEAMACGLPAVVSDAVGCGPDLIEEGLTGYVFPMGDILTLASSLAKMAALKKHGHDFSPALAAKLRIYSIENAVNCTIGGIYKSRA